MRDDPVGIAVVGFGYWGPNLLRNFAETPGATVRFVVDQRQGQLARAMRMCPSALGITDLDTALQDPRTHAVVIATPVATHFDIATRALRAGKHVLVEKPLAASAEQCLRLIDEAERRGLVILVDHTFVYTGPVRKIQELVAAGTLGDLYYYDSVRVNLGLFQHDVNVIWDLSVHDLSILEFVVSEPPQAVSAHAVGHVPGQPENMAYLTLYYDSSFIAHVNVNWLAPVKVRRTLIGGGRRMIVYDDLEPSEKLKVYDRGLDTVTDPQAIYGMLVSYRVGDMWAPRLDMTEGLSRLASHFVRCITEKEKPFTGAESGLAIVKILEAATESARNSGRLVSIN